jgi:hypothetical protein
MVNHEIKTAHREIYNTLNKLRTVSDALLCPLFNRFHKKSLLQTVRKVDTYKHERTWMSSSFGPGIHGSHELVLFKVTLDRGFRLEGLETTYEGMASYM